MIEIPAPRVLRFRYEEVMKHKPEIDDSWLGIDWFSVWLTNQYPEWNIEAKYFDQDRDYFYVILTQDPMLVYQEVRADDDGKLYIEEWVQ